jgi:hypothetical protein
MKKTEHLFYLIKSMTKAEKRYFKLYSSIHKTNSSFIEYYDYLVRESEGSKNDKYTSISKQGTVPVKRYLARQILKSLRSYGEKYSIDIQLQNQLSEIEILYNKKLGTQCAILIEKTRETASKQEKFGLLLQVFTWERKLKFLLDRTNRSESEISIDEKSVLNKYNNLNTYQRLFSDASELKKKLGYVDEKNKPYLIEKIIEHDILQHENSCLSKNALFYFYYTLTLSNWMLRWHKKSFVYSTKMFELVLKSQIDEDNFNGLLEHVTSCVCMGYYYEVIKKMKICEAVLKQNKINNNENTVSRFKYYQDAYLPISYMYIGDKKKLKRIVSETENNLIKNKDKLSKEAILVVNNNLRTVYVYLGNMKAAWGKQKVILTTIENKLRADVYDEMLLFNIFYYLDSNEISYAKAAVKTANSHFRERKYFKESIEYFILESCKNIEEYHKANQIHLVYEKIMLNIEEYTNRQEGLNGFIEDYYFYYFWAKSKFEEKNISDIMVEWHIEHSKQLLK